MRMPSVRKQACFLASCLLAAGCFNPAFTRLPMFGAGQPQVEKRSYERHDPFPDTFAAPDMQVRPRAFSDQRTEPRRALEEQLFQGMPGGGPVPSASPDLRGSQYRDSVRY
jgi:hypothetical protein